MSKKILLWIKHVRPPSLTSLSTLLTISCLIVSRLTLTQQQESEIDKYGIIVESGPYSLQFSLNETESYQLINVTCKNSKNEVNGNDQHKCEDLLPCLDYTAVLFIQYLDESQLIVESVIDDRTEYMEPTVKFTEIEAFEEEIKISWDATDRSCVKAFIITLKSIDNTTLNMHTTLNEQTELHFKDLHPCQDHTINLTAVDINEKTVKELEESATTLFQEPDNITNITIVNGPQVGQAHITWNLPRQTSCITIYYLKWSILDCVDNTAKVFSDNDVSPIAESGQVDSCTWFYNLTKPNAKEHTISGLQGCENYMLQIYLNSDTNLKSEQQNFTAEAQLPSPVILKDPKIAAVNATLYWERPTEHWKCVNFYKVFIIGPLQKASPHKKDTSTDDPFAFFDNLAPCGRYNYSVLSIDLNGLESSVVTSAFDTIEARPTAVRNHRVNAKPYSLYVSWDPPSFADLCIDKYRIAMWRDEYEAELEYENTTETTDILIGDLYSCQAYTVQVIPITKKREDGELGQIETETAADQPLPPSKVEETQTYSASAYVTAWSPDSKNKCEIIFARFYCKTEDENSGAEIKEAETFVESKLRGATFMALIEPLSPKTKYRCFVTFYNIAGWSTSSSGRISTWSSYATQPRNITVSTMTYKAIGFTWQEPEHMNGDLKTYKIHFQRVKPEYFIPPDCTRPPSYAVERETTSRQESFTDPSDYFKYSVQIAAQNEHGIGEYSPPFMIVTKPSASNEVAYLQVRTEGPYETEDFGYAACVIVTWRVPCATNGEIEAFELKFVGRRQGVEKFEQFSRTIPPNFDQTGYASHNETNLKPEYDYTVSVVVSVENITELSREQTIKFESPAGIPKRFNESTIAQARVDPFDAENPTNSALVRFPAYILDSEDGTIKYAALLLSQKNCNIEPSLLYGALNSSNDWPASRTWNEVYDSNNCVQQYQTTQKRWVPEVNPQTNYVEFVIGTEKCEGPANIYCNGPLKPDTEFYLVIRLFTKSGFNDAVLLDFHTDSVLQLTIILISVSCCLGLAFIMGFVYLYITKKRQMHRRPGEGIRDSFGDIVPKNFALNYKRIAKPENLAKEFKELTMVAVDLSCAASELGYDKNRYADIFPYDKNRVILDIDADGSDYINASFIDGYRRKKEYIATQGPKPESTMDFWRMVLQHNVRVIVMVTQFREGDTVKCHEYFPFKNKGINVVPKKKETFDIYDRTEMIVTHENYGMKQKVVHFYFKKWPDHGVPTEPQHLISFIRKVKAERVPSYSSIVIHCSAGVGRTGTFIGLDIIMQRMKNESKINIYETVKKLRFQRMKMVQTLAQYTFLYKCVYELVRHKYLKSTNNNGNENGLGMGNTQKKVSFEDDPEMNVGMSTLPHKYNSNRRGKASADWRPYNTTDVSNNEFRNNRPSIPTDVIRFDSPMTAPRTTADYYDARKDSDLSENLDPSRLSSSVL